MKHGICSVRRHVRRLVFLILATVQLALSFPLPAAASEDEVYVSIHKKSHQLQIVLNDIPVYTFPIATGRGDLTPIGEFRIVTKVVKPYYLPKQIAGGSKQNPLGTRWLGLNIGNGYKYGIHGTNVPSSIGRSASSGCVRMHNRDVEFVYRHLPLRTRVVIADD